MQKYSLDRHFVKIFVKITKKFWPNDPHVPPPLGYAPGVFITAYDLSTISCKHVRTLQTSKSHYTGILLHCLCIDAGQNILHSKFNSIDENVLRAVAYVKLGRCVEL